MPVNPPTKLQLEYIVESKCLVNDVLACENLNPLIDAAQQEFDDAVATASAALGHSVTVDPEVAEAKLNRLLEARALCKAMKATADAGGDAEQIANAQPAKDPIGVGMDFSWRRIE